MSTQLLRHQMGLLLLPAALLAFWTDDPCPSALMLSPADDLVNAVMRASPGDMLTLKDGVYSTTRTLQISKPITIRAVNPGKVEIQGGGTHLVLNVTGTRATFHGLNITGGNRLGFKGFAYAQSHPGAGALITSSTAEFQDCNVYSNEAPVGAGLMVQGSAITMLRCGVWENIANAGYGAGIFATSIAGFDTCSLTLKMCTIHNNTAEDMGGGVMLFGKATHAYLANCAIYGNKAVTQDGGGIMIHGATAVFSSCVVHANRAGGQGGESADEGSGNGGGLAQWGGSAHFIASVIYGNFANMGAGIFILDAFRLPDVSAEAVWMDASLVASQSTITANTARQKGGALYVAAGAVALLDRCDVAGNHALDVSGSEFAYVTSMAGNPALTGSLTTIPEARAYFGPPEPGMVALFGGDSELPDQCYTALGAAVLSQESFFADFGLPTPEEGAVVPSLVADGDDAPAGFWAPCSENRRRMASSAHAPRFMTMVTKLTNRLSSEHVLLHKRLHAVATTKNDFFAHPLT
mmetsp:Transcript_72619/g.121143  ORF Transcript_72619/g.121143 Transcript_72619/m.121143 type:complete len:522 (-) Transcript_72619:402-1967(-)